MRILPDCRGDFAAVFFAILFGSATFKYTIDKKGKKAVKVDQNGKVTARKKCKAVITVKTYNGKAKAVLKVTVK